MGTPQKCCDKGSLLHEYTMQHCKISFILNPSVELGNCCAADVRGV